jgi:hypothetical protein
MAGTIIPATDGAAWRSALAAFARIDVCQLPEYHVAYAARTPGSRPLLWRYAEGGESFCYPFLLTPAGWKTPEGSWMDTGYADISSIYGYSGPLATTGDAGFLSAAWSAFDAWASAEAKVIAEFIRFSPHAGTLAFAHQATTIEANRDIAVSRLPASEEALMVALDSKTRNMIRKAGKSALTARELEPVEWIPAFRSLYDETMDRNSSPGFFWYDDAYYAQLLALPRGELRLFGVFREEALVSAAIALIHAKGALYHLGASRQEFSSLGANNLCLFQMSSALLKQGVEFLNLGGGRTTAADDPLLRFKKSNGTGVEKFHIGKRILDAAGYQGVMDEWKGCFATGIDAAKLIFYR